MPEHITDMFCIYGHVTACVIKCVGICMCVHMCACVHCWTQYVFICLRKFMYVLYNKHPPWALLPLDLNVLAWGTCVYMYACVYVSVCTCMHFCVCTCVHDSVNSTNIIFCLLLQFLTEDEEDELLFLAIQEYERQGMHWVRFVTILIVFSVYYSYNTVIKERRKNKGITVEK